MALCCIGGVCIPYTAIIPLLIYALQWLLQKLADTGLLPDSISKQLQGFMITINNSKNTKEHGVVNCCNVAEKTSTTSNVRRGKQSREILTPASSGCTENQNSDHGKNVITIESNEDWERIITATEGMIVVCKFTAEWCKPCKEIQPLFESLSKSHHDIKIVKFVMIDVDVLDDIASTYNVLSLPTFVAIQHGRVLDKYSGSNPEQLKNFISTSVCTKS